ncbi:MAG TPA: cytochrome c oxidase subunit 3 [Gemmatimonadaceae bacterium]
MTAPESAVVIADTHALERRDVSWWGMSLFIATEAAVFVYLIASYFYVGGSAATWPPLTPSVRITGFNTILLLLSSGSAIAAEKSVKRNSTGMLRAWLAITIVLGGTFLAFQVYEYTTLEFHPQTDAYGSFFYLITGLHGAHVALGLLMLSYVLLRAFAGHFDSVRHSAVRNAILYWHFVDVVWLVVFTSLYLLPRMR